MEPADVLAMDKADIVASIFEGVMRTEAVLTKDEYERNLSLVETTTDAYATLLGSREFGWTYYGTGEVDEIAVTLKDDQGEVIDTYTIKHYKIKHYKGQKQPTLED